MHIGRMLPSASLLYTTTSCAIHRQRPCDTSKTNSPAHLRQGQPSWHRVIPRLRPFTHQFMCNPDVLFSHDEHHQMAGGSYIMHNKGATITVKYNDDIMEIDCHHLPHQEDISQSASTSLTVTSDAALSYLVQRLSTFATAHLDLYIREWVGSAHLFFG